MPPLSSFCFTAVRRLVVQVPRQLHRQILQCFQVSGDRRDIGDLLAVSDLFVISSRKEGLPMVLLEAMAASLPVVATRVGAIPGALDQGGCGDLVPPGDPPALAAAILALLDNPGRRAQLARLAMDKYHRCYSREAMGQQYVALYRRLLSPGP